jgi:hypothetical protein
MYPLITAKDTLETLGAGLGLLLAFCALIGLIAKYVVLPWLEDRFAPLAAKVNQTHHQVTTNGHVSQEPTLKDDVHSLANEVRELKGETRSDLDRMRQDLRTAGELYDRHLDWSSRHADQVWGELVALRKAIGHTENDGHPAAHRRSDEE